MENQPQGCVDMQPIAGLPTPEETALCDMGVKH